MSDPEEETQQQHPGETISPSAGGSTHTNRKFPLPSFADELHSRKAKWEEGRRRELELQYELQRIKLETGYDSDEYAIDTVQGQGVKKAVYRSSPIKPEKFPGKDFNRWELWVKHFCSVVKANGWSDKQAIAALLPLLGLSKSSRLCRDIMSENFQENNLPAWRNC